MSLYGSHKLSALLGFCAIMFRQTNVIWVAFCAGTVLAQKMEEAWKTEQTKKKDEKSPSPIPGSLAGARKITHFLLEFLLTPKNVTVVIRLTWPYTTVAMGFLVFIILNRGIVVGDRSSHEACLNFPQLFYFFSFTLVFSVFDTLSCQKIVNFFRFLKKYPLLFLFLTALSLFMVWKFTFVHKYLLADNRHYPFYIWKKIFQRHELVPFLLVPGYVFAVWILFEALKSKSLFWNLMFFACLSAASVPQKLLEFRYFILPYLIYRLNIPVPSIFRLILEIGFYTTVNTVTIYIFLNKTFNWPDSTDLQRFMW
ncbi:AG10B glucosyltransferase, partial [Atractosteus spatula]|nr:AG10B glucosyltransferase [Atractosteus spatula]